MTSKNYYLLTFGTTAQLAVFAVIEAPNRKTIGASTFISSSILLTRSSGAKITIMLMLQTKLGGTSDILIYSRLLLLYNVRNLRRISYLFSVHVCRYIKKVNTTVIFTHTDTFNIGSMHI